MINPKIFIPAVVLMVLLFMVIFAQAAEGTASWYSVESCRLEGSSGIMANGRRLDDGKFSCAAWGYPFGTILKVTNLPSGKFCYVEVTDRGPAKRLYRMGRIIDLSKRAFSEIASLKQGIIKVRVEEVRRSEKKKI